MILLPINFHLMQCPIAIDILAETGLVFNPQDVIQL